MNTAALSELTLESGWAPHPPRFRSWRGFQSRQTFRSAVSTLGARAAGWNERQCRHRRGTLRAGALATCIAVCQREAGTDGGKTEGAGETPRPRPAQDQAAAEGAAQEGESPARGRADSKCVTGSLAGAASMG